MTNRTLLAATATAVLVAGTGGVAIGANMVLLGSERAESEVGTLEVTLTSAELDVDDVTATVETTSTRGSEARTTAAMTAPVSTDGASDTLAAPTPGVRSAADLDGISAAEAIAIAEGHLPGAVLEVEMAVERGRSVYEVTLRTDDGRWAEIHVDAADGAVLRVEDEDEDDDLDDGDERDDDDERIWDGLTGAITPDAAVAAARAAVGGGDLIEVERDEHGGHAAYEVELWHDGRLTEITVDARSGAVLEIELDD